MKRIAALMPAWMGSIRIRLTGLYSIVLFGLAGAVVGGIYIGLSRTLDDEPVARTYRLAQLFPTRDGFIVSEGDLVTSLTGFESAVNARALDQLRTYSFLALGLLFVASLVVGWVIAGRVLQPIERITSVARDIQATDLSRRIHLEGPDDELRNLADTFDDMLNRLDVAFQGQRRFIQEASHELRNPLAVMRANLDVTLDDPDADADDLRHTAEIVGRSTERMARLVDDLMIWARQEHLSLRHDPVEVGEVVAAVAAEFEAPALTEGVSVRHASEPGLWVMGDAAALGRAVANLLANAIRVSISGTVIDLRSGRQGDWIFVEVADQGPGIDASDHHAVFQRFWRGDKAAAREEGRSGLGLTIVRQIAEAHGGAVLLDSALGTGATFTIRVPAVPADAPTQPLRLDV
ncbi:MAG: HAMP domain-containing histidine kinase [Acidimicrobiia bacterium]|nr:HAMP domain-containing histidine kinase [Acidimicrobiia bacterium]